MARVFDGLFNIKLALVSAVCNGLIALWINAEHGYMLFVAAGLTGAGSAFVLTGFTGRIVQYYSPFEPAWKSYSLGSVVPASVTFVLSFAAHKYGGTPDLWESCLAQTAISFATSFGTNRLTRVGHFRPRYYKES